MPDDMKARIQALVDKKVAEEKAAAEADAKSDSSWVDRKICGLLPKNLAHVHTKEWGEETIS